jgi:hypothetical protein
VLLLLSVWLKSAYLQSRWKRGGLKRKQNEKKERMAHHRHANAAAHLGQSAPQVEEGSTAHCHWPQAGYLFGQEARYSHCHLLWALTVHRDHAPLDGSHSLEDYMGE